MIYGGRRWLAWTWKGLGPEGREALEFFLGRLDERGALGDSRLWLRARSPEELRAMAAFRGIDWDREVWEDADWMEKRIEEEA